MERREKVLIGIAVGAVVGLLALAAPAVIGMIPTDEVVAEAPTLTPTRTPEPVASATPTPTREPVVTPTPTPTPAESACLRVTPGKDRGATYPGADGSVEKTNGGGLATVYRVASNDSYWAILDRFCVDGDTFDSANGFAGAEEIYEGDYLAILPEGAGDAAALNEAANGGYRTHQDCDAIARIELSEPDGGRIAVSLSGQIVDSGEGEYAEGPVESVDGVPTYYTVQPGDTYRGIGDRFCVDSITVQAFNDGGGPESVLQPGDRVQLRPTSGSIEYQG